MKRLGRFLLKVVAVLVVLVLIVLGVRLVNGWRFPDPDETGDPRDLASYELEQEGMSVEHVVGDYLNGFRLLPDDVTRDGVVVTFGGSEGSPDFERAVQLASEGYEVYALFFFGQENQSTELERVPLEFFEELEAEVEDESERPGPLTLIGASKGAELSLLLASQYEEIDNVVLFAPTAHVFQALAFGGAPVSSWTRDGQDVPFLSFEDASAGALVHQLSAMAFNYPVAYRSTYETVVERASQEQGEAAALDAEAVDAQLLVFAGGDDEMWPSDTSARAIGAANPQADVHIYSEAGHIFHGGAHYGPLATGGTEQANAAAGEESDQVLRETLADWHS